MEDTMQFHSDIKPISWLKNNAKRMLESVDETGNPMIITQNGEAKAVIMNVRAYDQMQESLALLRMLADSSADAEAGRLRDSDEVFADIGRMIARQRDARK
jgi:prevent-host-death family protein